MSKGGLRSAILQLAGGRGLAAILSAAWLLVAARLLFLPAFGDLAVLLALGGIFTTLSDPGTITLFARDSAERGHVSGVLLDRVLRRRLVAALIASSCLTLLYLAAASVKDPVVPLLFSVSIVASAVYGSALGAYRSLGRVAMDAANEVVSRCFVLGFGTVLLLNGAGLRGAVMAYAAADLASAVIVSTLVRRRHVVANDGSNQPSLRLAVTLPFALAGAVAVIYYRVDTYMVGLLRGAPEAGLYGVAYKFLDGCLIPALAVEGLVIAQTARLTGAARWRRGRRLARTGVAITLPQAAVLAIFAAPILQLALGARYLGATWMLRILMLAAVPSAVVAILAPLSALASPRAFLGAALAALVINVALNLAAITVYGGFGAAAVNVFTQVLLAGMFVQILRRHLVAPATS